MKSLQSALIRTVHKVLYWMIFGATNKEIIKVATLLQKYNINSSLITHLANLNSEIPRVVLQGYVTEDFNSFGEPYEHIL